MTENPEAIVARLLSMVCLRPSLLSILDKTFFFYLFEYLQSILVENFQ